jgi:hypothetical protein
MPIKAKEEKRETARVPADLRVRSTAAGELLELSVVNLSLGGAYCGSPRAIEPMTRLEVILDLPGSGAVSIPVAAQAVVVRMHRAERLASPHPFLLALWFQRMTDSDRARLRRFLGQDGN